MRKFFSKLRFTIYKPCKNDLLNLRFTRTDLVITAKNAFYVKIFTIRFLVILSFFFNKSEKKKLVILSKINSGFSAKLVFPPLDVESDIWM